MIQFKTTLN